MLSANEIEKSHAYISLEFQDTSDWDWSTNMSQSLYRLRRKDLNLAKDEFRLHLVRCHEDLLLSPPPDLGQHS